MTKYNLPSKKNRPRRTLNLALSAVCILAGGAADALAQSAAAPAPSRVDALLNFEFSNEYLTPRGMIVQDKGLTFQPLVLGFADLYKNDTGLNDITLIGGFWNDLSTAPVSIHAPYGSSPKTAWVETDPIAGLSFTFAKRFKLEADYTAFFMHIEDIGTSQHFFSTLTFDDSDYLKAFALHPFLTYWQELYGKATDANVPEAVFGPSPHSGSHPAPNSSYYLEVGVDPSYTFTNIGNIKLELPGRVLLPNSRFYGDYYAPSSTVGLWELSFKASIPLKFMPAGFGHWSFHAGVNYMYFVDDNLYNLNTFNAPGKPTRDNIQGFCGLSLFF